MLKRKLLLAALLAGIFGDVGDLGWSFWNWGSLKGSESFGRCKIGSWGPHSISRLALNDLKHESQEMEAKIQ